MGGEIGVPEGSYEAAPEEKARSSGARVPRAQRKVEKISLLSEIGRELGPMRHRRDAAAVLTARSTDRNNASARRHGGELGFDGKAEAGVARRGSPLVNQVNLK